MERNRIWLLSHWVIGVVGLVIILLPLIIYPNEKKLKATDKDYEISKKTGLKVDKILELRAKGYSFDTIIELDKASDKLKLDIDYILSATKKTKEFQKIIKLLGLKEEDFKLKKEYNKSGFITIGEAIKHIKIKVKVEEPTYKDKKKKRFILF